MYAESSGALPYARRFDVAHQPRIRVPSADVRLGKRREDISIEVHDRVLSIRGERRPPASCVRSARYGAFERAWRLPENVDVDSVSAHLDGGVLTVRVPKTATPKPRKIAIAKVRPAWWSRASEWLRNALR
jgi:hypothetical protein